MQQFLKQFLFALVVLPLSAMADTKLSVGSFDIAAGETKDLSIDLENTDMEVTCVQFDLRLPEGLSLAIEDDEYAIDITDRTTFKKHSLDANFTGGAYRFLLASSKNAALTGTSGSIITASIVADANFTTGTISVENITIVSPDEKEVKQDDFSFTVGHLAVKVIVNDATRKYGEANPTFTYTVQPANIDLTGKLTLSCDATVKSGVGEYAITATSSATDMSVTCVAGKLTVTPAPLKVAVKDAECTYGANATYEFEYTGFVNDDTEAVLTQKPTVSTKATVTSSVGTYTITPTGGKAANYEFTDYQSGTLTIKKASLTVTSTASRTYGEENPDLTLTYTGFVNSETASVLKSVPTAKTTATKESNAGTYPIVVTGGEAENYDIECKDGTLTVNKARLLIWANDFTKVYGEENPELTYTCSGFVNNESESVLTSTPDVYTKATKYSSVGKYDISVDGADAVNYSFSYLDGTLEITKAPLQVKAADVTWHSGDEWPVFELIYEGFKNNETEEVLTKKPEATTTATKDSPEGTYAITVSGGEAVNYTFSYAEGTMTVLAPKETFVETGATYEVEDDNTVTFTGIEEETTTEPVTVCDIPESVTYEGKTYPVTSIAAEAFKGNETLEQVSIPQSVESIGKAAFAGCKGLKTIVIYVAEPIDLGAVAAARGAKAEAGSVFEGVDLDECVLFVPVGSVEKYRNADVWKEFKQILPITSLGVSTLSVKAMSACDVYDLKGRKVRAGSTSLEGLAKGMYIIGGRKVVIK